jgi:hypothetical protein
MNLSEYVSQISFRFRGPNAELPRPLERIANFVFVGGSPFIEAYNTRLPEQENRARHALFQLCRIPRMSTYAIAAVINHGVSLLPEDQVYLNVGVWNGFTFLAGLVNNPDKVCIGVDNFSEFGGPRSEFLKRFEKYRSLNHRFYDADYREYLTNRHSEEIGFYFYDGPHSLKDQVEGLELAERFFASHCIILVDDTNEPAPRKATLDFVESRRHDYRVIFDQRTPRNQHPTFWNGITIVEKTK